MIEIKRATIEDLKKIQKLNLMLFEKEQKEYDSTFNLNWTFGEDGTNFFLGSIKNKNACVVVAKSGGKIVGYLAGVIRETSSCRIIENQAELDNMFVLEEFRGQKIGKKLVNRFFEWAT